MQFYMKFKIGSSSSAKSDVRVLLDCVESVDSFGHDYHPHSGKFYPPRTRDAFSLIWVFKFFQQCFVAFNVQVFHLFG